MIYFVFNSTTQIILYLFHSCFLRLSVINCISSPVCLTITTSTGRFVITQSHKPFTSTPIYDPWWPKWKACERDRRWINRDLMRAERREVELSKLALYSQEMSHRVIRVKKVNTERTKVERLQAAAQWSCDQLGNNFMCFPCHLNLVSDM